MVLVSYRLYITLVFYKLNSAMERGTKPDAVGWNPCHWTKTLTLNLSEFGGVSNVDIDENNTLQIKSLGVAISTFETLLAWPAASSARCCSRSRSPSPRCGSKVIFHLLHGHHEGWHFITTVGGRGGLGFRQFER